MTVSTGWSVTLKSCNELAQSLRQSYINNLFMGYDCLTGDKDGMKAPSK